MSDDFWENFTQGVQGPTASAVDLYLQGKLDVSEMAVLTDRGRAKAALGIPVDAGTRVAFITNLGTLMSYADPPESGMEGTVVMVRTAEGDATSQGDNIFVKWDDGRFMAMHREHLRKSAQRRRLAFSVRRKVSSLGDLSGFLHAKNANELIHKATKDLWSFERTEGGDFVINRLFDDTGEPLKV